MTTRIYILPTWNGLWFLAWLFILLSMAAVLVSDLAILTVIALTGVMFAGLIRTHYNLVGLRVAETLVPGHFAGEEIAVSITLTNTARFERVSVRVSALPEYGKGGWWQRVFSRGLRDPGAEALVAGVKPKGKTVCVLKLPPLRRGRYAFPRIRIATHHPLGMFGSWSWTRSTGEFYVYPRPAGNLPAESGDAEDDGNKTGRAGGEDFHGHRLYQPGDSIRQVNWKAHAKGLPLVTKVFHEEQSPRSVFRWDDTASLGGDEARLEQLSAWLVAARRCRRIFGLQIPGTDIPPADGGEHLQRCLKALAVFGTGVPA